MAGYEQKAQGSSSFSVYEAGCSEWYGMAWYGMVWYSMVWYNIVWYGWYGMVWYGIVVLEKQELLSIQNNLK